ncbi:MAG: nucleotide-binding protein [Desulfobacteraceae bacterium]|nr:nucleotide-binding protein [Desulfobacteraceae bacterium]
MKDISKQDIVTLVKLQEAETEIVRLQAVLGKVEKEKTKIALRLKQFEKALYQNREDLARVQIACRDSESEIQIIDDRIIKSNENLRMVKTNKEYQVLLREVDDNKKRKDILETELLEFMDEKEKSESIVSASEKEYALLAEQISHQQAEMGKKCVDDKEALEEYLAQQEDIGESLDSTLMEKFRKISKMNQGLAVTGVDNAVCMGCFMNIPPQLFIEVQRGSSLISCPQCSRILYHVNTD